MKARVILSVTLCLGVSITAAQDQPKQPPSTSPDKATTKAEEIPPSEEISMETKDRVSLKATWFPGVNEKDSVPVILLHDWDSSRLNAMLALGQYLQREAGCAVIAPDLRGHGDSTQVVGATAQLDYEKFDKAELASVTNDIEACKKFLMEKNNAGQLNIDMLCVVAANETTPLAMTWATVDWSWAPLGGKRQGQDVKALVLLSPIRKFKHINVTDVLRNPVLSSSQVPGITTMLMWDSGLTGSEREASAIENLLLKSLGDQPKPDSPDRWDTTRLFLKVADGGGKGEKLLTGPHGEFVRREIADFVINKFNNRKEKYSWSDRSE